MARIVSETVTVSFSRLVRDDDNDDYDSLVSDEAVDTIDAALQEVLGGDNSLVIEVNKDDG